MKENKGITLIVLVITIIILLILAGITIATITGDNGLFGRAKQAKEETLKEAAVESINLKITNILIDAYVNTQEMTTLQKVADALCEDEEVQYVELTSKKEATLTKIDTQKSSSIFTKLKDYPYEFEINSSLQLASIDGVKTSNNTENMVSKEVYEELEKQYTELENKYEELEKSTVARSEYDTLLSRYNTLSNSSKSLTFVNQSRSQCTIPSGVEEAYVYFSNSTNDSSLSCTITGNIIQSQEMVSSSTAVDNYGYSERCSLGIYKLKLSGEQGTIKIGVSGGAGTRRAWTTIVSY